MLTLRQNRNHRPVIIEHIEVQSDLRLSSFLTKLAEFFVHVLVHVYPLLLGVLRFRAMVLISNGIGALFDGLHFVLFQEIYQFLDWFGLHCLLLRLFLLHYLMLVFQNQGLIYSGWAELISNR